MAEVTKGRVKAGREEWKLPAVQGSELSAPTSFLAVIARAAADPACNTEKMASLLSMQRQIEEREAEKAFTRDFIALQDVLPVIDKDGKIDHGAGKQKNLYSTYPNIMKVCKPLLRRHGFALASWIEPAKDGARIEIVSQLDHVEHHHRTSRFPLPAEQSGSKNIVQAWGSSQQYGMRYNAIALLNIVSEAPQDRDHDGNVGNFKRGTDGYVDVEPIRKLSRAQAAELEEVMKDCGVTVRGFCEIYGIKAVADLNDDLFEAAKKRCLDYKAKRGGNG